MDDGFYGQHDREPMAASRHMSHNGMLQHQFKKTRNEVVPHQRYRATQYDDPKYDTVENDELYGDSVPYDSFGAMHALSCRSVTDDVW